jgi:EF-P beta-lysylation protein EpmB
MNWRKELVNSYTRIEDLLSVLELDINQIDQLISTKTYFPFRVTQAYASRIRPRDPNDPLLLQVLPTSSELLSPQNFSDDPVGEEPFKKDSSLLQKYHGRALLVATGACAINCRYCFRRAFPYQHMIKAQALENAIEQISRDLSIKEVILSGGDPLILDDQELETIFESLQRIRHVERLRIHSRLPIVLPSRVTKRFTRLMRDTSLNTSLVVHVNHPNELDNLTIESLRRCKDNGLILLNQSVLLKNINNDIKTLTELSEVLFSAGVLPYYMHLLDRVKGASHFEVSDTEALNLETQLRTRLSGYLMPTFVREIAKKGSKIPLAQI